jgi:hypothetical protein
MKNKLTDFEKCRREFDKLTAPVNNDPLAQTTVADLYFSALFELDLHHEGEQVPELTKSQVSALEKFTEKWAGK